MKKIFGIILIIIGIITLFSYPNFGKDGAETVGALFGISLVTFLPAYLLISSENKDSK